MQLRMLEHIHSICRQSSRKISVREPKKKKLCRHLFNHPYYLQPKIGSSERIIFSFFCTCIICSQIHPGSILHPEKTHQCYAESCSKQNTFGFSSTFCFDFRYSSLEMRTPAEFRLIHHFMFIIKTSNRLNRNIN